MNVIENSHMHFKPTRRASMRFQWRSYNS